MQAWLGVTPRSQSRAVGRFVWRRASIAASRRTVRAHLELCGKGPFGRHFFREGVMPRGRWSRRCGKRSGRANQETRCCRLPVGHLCWCDPSRNEDKSREGLGSLYGVGFTVRNPGVPECLAGEIPDRFVRNQPCNVVIPRTQVLRKYSSTPSDRGKDGWDPLRARAPPVCAPKSQRKPRLPVQKRLASLRRTKDPAAGCDG